MAVKTFGGFYEDNAKEQCRCYTFEDVEKEQHLFSASSEEHCIIVKECRECAKAGKPTDKAMTVITCPGQPFVDGLVAPSEPLRKRLVTHRLFRNLKLGRGGAVAIPLHFRSGAATCAPFDGYSGPRREKAGQERLSLYTGVAASRHTSKASALTTDPKLREPLSTKIPGCDDDTGVDCWRVKEGEPEEVRPISGAGVTCHCAGGYDLNTGKFGVDLMRVETTADELEDRHRATRCVQYSPFAASQFRDTELGFSKATCWDDTLVDRRKCSIPGACLAMACGCGGLHDICRPYYVDAFETYPLALAHDLYGKSSMIEFDYSWELKWQLKAFLNVDVEWSGAFREDMGTAAFDVVFKQNPDSMLEFLKKRDAVVELKYAGDMARTLGIPVPSGHGALDAATSRKKAADKQLVDFSVCFLPSHGQSGATAFGPDRSRAAARRRFDLVSLRNKYIREEKLGERDAMMKASRYIWQRDPSSKFRCIVAATANLKKDGEHSSFDVAHDGEGRGRGGHHVTDIADDMKEAFEAAFNANAAKLTTKKPHLGEDQFQPKPLTQAVLNELPSLDQVLAVAPSNVASSSSPPRASWAPAVERYRAAFRAAKAKEAEELKGHLSNAAAIELICSRMAAGSLDSDDLKVAGSVGLRFLRLACEEAERKLAAEKGARVRGRGAVAPAPDARRRRSGDSMEE